MVVVVVHRKLLYDSPVTDVIFFRTSWLIRGVSHS